MQLFPLSNFIIAMVYSQNVCTIVMRILLFPFHIWWDQYNIYRDYIQVDKKQMGQSSINEKGSYKFGNGGWTEPTDNNQNHQQVNQYCTRVLVNPQTKQSIEQYQLYFISEVDFNEHSNEYSLRKDRKIKNTILQESALNVYQSAYIYKIKEFINTSTIDICSTIHKGLLYVEKVDLRLKEITDIPFDDHLCLTFVTLQGFKLLYQKIGYFDITEEMIFINYQGEVRVWINPNLSKHEPFRDNKSQQFQELHGSQSYMIINLLTIIQKNTDSLANDWPTFQKHLINKGIFDRLSFYKALEEFQIYCLQYKLSFTTYLKSIYDLYNDQPNKLEQSSVYRFQTLRDFNKHLSHDKSQMSSREKYRKFSPLVKLKSINLHQSQASKKSYYSQQSNKRQIHLKQQDALNNQKSKRPSSSTNQINTNALQVPNNLKYSQQQKKTNQNKVYLDNTAILQLSSDQQQFSLGNSLKYDALEMKPIIPSRLNFIRTTRIQKQEQKAPQPIRVQEQSKNPVSLMKHQFNTKTINTMNSVSTFSAKQTEIFQNRSKQFTTRINFYSPNQVYSLDHEIMQDLQKMLGFNPNNF